MKHLIIFSILFTSNTVFSELSKIDDLDGYAIEVSDQKLELNTLKEGRIDAHVISDTDIPDAYRSPLSMPETTVVRDTGITIRVIPVAISFSELRN